MKVAASTVVPLPSAIVKMEDRKRSAGHSIDDIAPPTKRQAVNGSSKASADSDMPWKDFIEEYQKDAIYRQMLEYKREKSTLESQLRDVQKKSVDHDDHLRVVDAWWSQLLEEVTLLSGNITSSDATSGSDTPFPTALRFKGSAEFADHLSKKSKEIKAKVNELFSNLAAASGQSGSVEVEEFQKKVTSLLALQKEQLIKNDRLRAEKSELGERLETASLRYLKAEKKLDRVKSEPVAKVEASAIATSTANNGATDDTDKKSDGMNGVEYSSAQSEATHLAYKEAQASLGKQKEQLDAVMAENKALTEQLTVASSKLSNLSDDDYARTELFKSFKSQHEDVIKRINNLEATNIQLREEAEKLQAERTAYRSQVDMESETITGDLQAQLQRVESDLTRIRSARDELIADQSTRKAHQDQEKEAVGQMKELCSAKDDRIAGLQSEVERLRAQLEEHSAVPTPQLDVNDMDVEELRRKYIVLEQSFQSVNNELPAMEKAYKRSMTLASKKVMDFTAMEEKVTMLIAEKAKADQKYFAARKDMDTRIGEVRALRVQNAKSSEIISQLKDVEAANKTLLTSLEKQVSELRQGNFTLASENKRLFVSNADATSKVDNLKSQISELTNMLKTKDSSYSAAKQHIHSIELDLEKLQVKLEAAIKEKEVWKAKGLSNSSAEEEMLRALALCTVCRNQFKNTVLKGCGHIFCNTCVEDRIANRYRKCPTCSKAFDKADAMTVHM